MCKENSGMCCGSFMSDDCNSVLSSVCSCDKGTYHDLFILRQRSCCYDNQPSQIAIIIIILIISTIGFIYSIFTAIKLAGVQHLQKKQMAQIQKQGNIVILLVFCFFTLLLFCFGNLINKFSTDGTLLFIIYVLLSLVSGAIYASIYAVVSPILNLVHIPEDGVFFRLKVIFSLFRVIQFCLGTTAITKYENPKNPLFDPEWNRLIALFFLSFGLEILAVSVYFMLIKRSVVEPSVKEIKGSSADRRIDIGGFYMTRVNELSRKFLFIAIPLAFYLFVISVIYLAQSHFPSMYVAFLIFWLALSMALLYGSYLSGKDQTLPASTVDEVTQVKSEKMGNQIPALSRGLISEMTTIQSVTNVKTVSDPVLLANNPKWRQRSNWIEAKDEDGMPCYYNTVTKEWSFDPPSGVA